MMNFTTSTLDGRLDVLRQNEITLLTDIATTLAIMGDDARDDSRRLNEVAQDLREMFFLVVVIGEFNAGKSTFVNALVGEALLPMDITPTTSKIELVRYSETAKRAPLMRGDAVREWEHPNTGAPGVAIVDTPGTGSIYMEHEAIAKSFLHRSDLVIFLLSAKRAFAQTERVYLELVKQYSKKVVLVINQVDLLEPNERETVRRFVEQQVKELLGLQPLIFMISAKEALKGAREGGDPNAGGLDAVRAHLRGVYSETPIAKQKLLTQLDLAGTLTQRHFESVRVRSSSVSGDTSRLRDIQYELEKHSGGMSSQLVAARREVEQTFAGIRTRGLSFIEEKLKPTLFKGAPSKEALQSEFQDVVIGRALRDVNEASTNYVNALVDHSRVYWRSVIDRLNALKDQLETEVTGLDASAYAQQRESLEEAVRLAEQELRSYSSGKVMEDLQSHFAQNLNGFKTGLLAALGGLLAIAAAIAAPGPLVTVGTAIAAPWALPLAIVGAPVVLVGGWAAVRYYQRVKNDTRKEFETRLDALENTYYNALDELTHKEQERLTKYGVQVLSPIFDRLEILLQQTNAQVAQIQQYLDRVENLRREIDAL